MAVECEKSNSVEQESIDAMEAIISLKTITNIHLSPIAWPRRDWGALQRIRQRHRRDAITAD